jgi:hypothetical protein
MFAKDLSEISFRDAPNLRRVEDVACGLPSKMTSSSIRLRVDTIDVRVSAGPGIQGFAVSEANRDCRLSGTFLLKGGLAANDCIDLAKASGRTTAMPHRESEIFS